jgi:preprotein translocase subunit SecG
VLFQLRGGGIGGIFGQADSVYRTRRGIESTLLKLTIILAVVLVVLATLIAAQP